MKRFVLLILISFSLFTGCSSVSDEDLIKAREAVKNGAIIVDVRTPSEYRRKHIASAINIPIENIMKGAFNLPKNVELVLYCRTGSRSSASARVLSQQGWTVHDVATQDDWEREIKKK